MTYTDENSSDIPILSLLSEEMDLRGRVGKIFQMKSPKLTIQSLLPLMIVLLRLKASQINS
jgi:hypothetical protein